MGVTVGSSGIRISGQNISVKGAAGSAGTDVMKAKLSAYIPAVLIAVLFGIILSDYLSGANVLLGSDPVIASANLSFSGAVRQICSNWNSTPLLGMPAVPNINLVRILLAALQDGVLWNNWYHGLGCLLASWLLMSYLRREGCSMFASLLAAVGAFWVGFNFTLIYSGHPAKPYIVMLFVGALLAAARAVKGPLLYSLLWGGCIGLMFTHQPDVALFFALFSGAWLIFKLYRELGFKAPGSWARILLPALGFAFLLAWGPLWGGYKTQVKSSVQAQSQSPQEKWDYVTQWSLPPGECVQFFAPGYCGWRTGDPAGPYWGKMGRSAGWDEHHQGFQNFQLDNPYIGWIPIAFALFAVWAYWRTPKRPEILFWAISAVVALLLGMGKFSPLYKLFYQLPVVNNIRAPVKFIQVFQVCLALLTAYGFDFLLKSKGGKTDQSGRRVRYFFPVVAVILVVMLLWWLGLMISRDSGVAGLTGEGYSQQVAQLMVQNKIVAAGHALFMAGAVCAVFALFSFSPPGSWKRMKTVAAGLLIVLTGADALKLSKQYVKTMPRSYIASNVLTAFLSEHCGNGRVALADVQQLNGVLKTYTLPYNHIPVFNPGDISRMSVEYKNFLQALGRNPLALWEFASVKYLLAPSKIVAQVPAARMEKVFSYRAVPGPGGGFLLQADEKGPLAVFEMKQRVPRYALFAGSKKMPEQDALKQLADFSVLSLSPDAELPELSGRGMCGAVEVKAYRPGRVVLSVTTETDAILRCADYYTADWQAALDGQSVPVEPVDYLCQGVLVPAGTHTLELFCGGSKLDFYLQLGGHVLFCGLLAAAWFRRDHSPESAAYQ